MSWLDRYFQAMQAANRSPGTIRLHRHYLAQLRRMRSRPALVTGNDLLDLLTGSGWAPESMKSARTVYRGFFRWAHGVGLLDEDPALVLPAVAVSPGLPRPTPELIARQVMRDADRRIALMAMLAGFAGLRAGEIACVHSDDYSDGLLRVLGKGRRLRSVPIVAPELDQALSQVCGWAFPGRVDGHLSPGTVTRYLSRALPGGWTAHTLRHRAGTRAYAGTHDLLAVGQMLGHSRPETTQRYVLVDNTQLRAAALAAAS